MSDGVTNNPSGSNSQRKVRDVLPMSLRKMGQSQAIDHAVVIFPSSYEVWCPLYVVKLAKRYKNDAQEALVSAHEVFKISSSSNNMESQNMELRYPIRKEGEEKYEWGRILPKEWLDIVGEGTEEIGVFVIGDVSSPPRYDEKNSTSQKNDKDNVFLFLFRLCEMGSRNVEDKRFVVPLVNTYEECVSAAYECFSSIAKNKKKCQLSSIVLLGKFAAVKPDAPPIFARLTTPAAYATYIATKRESAIEFAVTW
ncbi:hypothetical protein CVT25_006138 [Psilocybe cyanescens]|uniref:Uncharacterized protein n=1 Tax=Psilocybe cyanescens TaxID=93625 RepID=A0A409WYY1_PSICY|nr:hypothetical protein CVT25_006138 [Psilocybe cyanescens]